MHASPARRPRHTARPATTTPTVVYTHDAASQALLVVRQLSLLNFSAPAFVFLVAPDQDGRPKSLDGLPAHIRLSDPMSTSPPHHTIQFPHLAHPHTPEHPSGLSRSHSDAVDTDPSPSPSPFRFVQPLSSPPTQGKATAAAKSTVAGVVAGDWQRQCQ